MQFCSLAARPAALRVMTPRPISPTKPERKAERRAGKRTYLLRDVPEESWQGLRRLAYEQETTMREVILAAIRREIERAGKREGK